MDIPLPEESQPPGLPDGQVSTAFPLCDNIPLPSCGMQFNTTAFPPQFPQTALPIAAPILPPEAPPLLQTPETNIDPTDDPNRYSPSRATAEDDIPATPPSLKSESAAAFPRAFPFGQKTTVLGKAQAKKRLLAFSMTKQGGGAGLSFGFQKKVIPKVNTGSAKVFAGAAVNDDGIQERKETAVKQEKVIPQGKKKISKKGLSRDDKARAVVSAIEEIKREELMLRGAIPFGSLDLKTSGDMTAPIPLLGQPLGLSLKPKDEFDLSGNPLLEQQKGAIESLLGSLLSQTERASNNDKAGVNSEVDADTSKSDRHDGGRRKEDRKKDSDRGTGSQRRSERKRSKERHSRSGKDRHKEERRSRAPTELPTSWSHFHSGGYRIEEIRRLKLKLDDRDLGGSSSGSRSRDRHRKKSRDCRSRSREDRKHRKSPTHDGDKERKTEEELDHLYRPFEGPPRLRFPLVITNSAQMVVEYPRGFIRYTKTRPPVAFCENPDSTRAHFRSRTEILNDATSEVVELMKQIMNSKQQEDSIRIKREPGENLSSSLAALQVSYDEAEVGGSPSSPENVGDGRRKERSWFSDKEYLISTEHEGKDENLMSDAGLVVKNEKEDPDMEREIIIERKLSIEGIDTNENDNVALSNNEQDKEETSQRESPEVALNVSKTERTTVRSKWDSDYEEDMMSAEEVQLDVMEKESLEPDMEVSSKVDISDLLGEERQNMSVEEFDKDLDTQREEHVLQDEEISDMREDSLRVELQQEEAVNETKENVEEKEDDKEDGYDDDMQISDYPMQTEEVNKVDMASAETSNEGNTDQKLVSEYEEFMKAVSFDTVLPDEQCGSGTGDEPCQQQESAESDKEPLEEDIFERQQLELNVNDTWDEDSKEEMEEREERVNIDFMMLEKVIRDGRDNNNKKKKKQDLRARSSSSSSEEEDVKSKKQKKKKINKHNEKRKKENRKKSYSSDSSSSSDDSSSSSSEDDREKRKHVIKKEKSRKKSEEISDVQINETAEKPKSKYKKASKRKKKSSRKRKQQRKRTKKRKVETSSSSDDSSDSDEESSSSRSERGHKRHKTKENRSHRKDDGDSSSEDSSSSSSTDSSSSSSSSSHGKISKKKRRKNSKKTKKEVRKKRKEKSRKKKKHRRDSVSSDIENNSKGKISKSNRKIDGSRRLSNSRNLDNGNETVSLEELEAQLVKRRQQCDDDAATRLFGNTTDMDTDQRSRQISLREGRKSLTLEPTDSNLSMDENTQKESENEENSSRVGKRIVLKDNDVNSSGESCWEEIHRPKRKRDSHESVIDSASMDIEDDDGRELEKRKVLKKRRRDRRSHSASPLSNLGRKRRRSPSTSPEHSPTPQRRSSTEGKDKGRRESAVSRNQTDSGHHLKHGDGSTRMRGESQEDMELDAEDFVDHPGIRDHSFIEEVDQSDFESCTDDTFEGFNRIQTELAANEDLKKDDRNKIFQEFSSSEEDDLRQNKYTKNLISQNVNKIHRRHNLKESNTAILDTKDRDSSEKDNSSPLLREIKQEIVSEDEEFTAERKTYGSKGVSMVQETECIKDKNLQASQNSSENDSSSNKWNMKADDNDNGSDNFFSRCREKKEPQNSNNKAPDVEESDSIYSPGDPFDGLDSDSLKKNISDYVDSSSQNSDLASKIIDNYQSDMSLDSLNSPPGNVAVSTAAIHNQDSCGISSKSKTLKATDQWSGCNSPSQGSSSKGNASQHVPFMSLENIPLPPPSSSQKEEIEKINVRQHDNFDQIEKSCEQVLPPLPSMAPPVISSSSNSNSSLSEDVGVQVSTSENDTKTSASQRLESPVGQRKLSGKPAMQKHVITVKLLSPLARLQSASESKSVEKTSIVPTSDIQVQKKASIQTSTVTESPHTPAEVKNKSVNKEEGNIESVCPDESSASNEVNKCIESEAKVQIKHPWKSFGFSLKGEGSSLTLYDDLETSTTEQIVSSTTVKSIPDVEKEEKSLSGEAIAKERIRKRPSRWGMMTTPVKPVSEDIQQDAAVTSQQKCDTDQYHVEAASADNISCLEGKDGDTGDQDLYKFEHTDVSVLHKHDFLSSQDDRSSRRKSSNEIDMDSGPSQMQSRRDSSDCDSRRMSVEKHSRDDERRDRRERWSERDRDRTKDKSEDREINRRLRSEDTENESRRRGERNRDKRWKERSSDRDKRDEKREEITSETANEQQNFDQRREYRDYSENIVESHDGNSFSDSHLPSDYKTDWQDGGESSHGDRPVVRSDSGWGDSGDYSIQRLSSAVDTPWESRVVRYRSRSRSLSPEFRGWEETPVRRVREDDQGRGRLEERKNSSRERYDDQQRLSLERQDLGRHESTEDDRIRESSRDRDRIRNSSRDHERMSGSSRERLRGNSRDRLRESSRDRDRMRESSRDQDRIRENSRDREKLRESNNREHDRIRESGRDQDRLRQSGRDQDTLREDSRDRERLRTSSRDQDRLRESNRDPDRMRDNSRDRDRLRDNSRDCERIRERQEENRDRRDERCIRDRWNDGIDRGRDRTRDRRGDRHWEKERRERKKDERNRDHDRDRGRWTERRSRSPLLEDGREHEISGPGYYIPDIPLPMASGGDSWGPSSGVGSGEADMELSCSPASSPLVGFKRSLADSTISDSELVAAAGKQEEHHPSSPFQQHSGYYNTERYPPPPYTQKECNISPTLSPSFSPKRISLDDRIELELGVKKSPPPLPPVPQQIPVYHHQTYPSSYPGYQSGNYYPIPPPQPHYEGNTVAISGNEKAIPSHSHYVHPHEEFAGPPQHENLHHHHKQYAEGPSPIPSEEKYGPTPSKRRPPLLPTPSNIAPDMSHWESPEAFIGVQDAHKMVVTPESFAQHGQVMMPSEGFMGSQQLGGNSHVVQVGNVLQVVPTDLPPGSVLGALPPPPPPAHQPQAHKSMVLQAGNMLQVIPSENLPVPNASGSGGTQVFQVGNMLQVVPGASPSPTPPGAKTPQHVVMTQVKVVVPNTPAAVPPPPATPQPGIQAHVTAEMSMGHSPVVSSPIAKVPPSPRHTLSVVPGPPLPLSSPVNPSMAAPTSSGIFPARPLISLPATRYSPPASPFLISEPQPLMSASLLPAEVASVVSVVSEAPIPFLSPSESPREEAERRREERERRRQEKEKRRREKEKRRQSKLKHAADNLIKKALQQEGDHTDIDLEEMRLIEEAMRQVPDCEDEATCEIPQVTPPKKKRRPPIQVKPLPPAGKGILISPGFREKPITGENEERKSVKFADGVRPGEGTSPSAGEDLPSPPPPPRKLPKEKRFKKKKKKKIKVKIIRQINVEDEDDEDDISPPPPPPGSPPPPPMYPPGYTTGYPPAGYIYSQPTSYTVLPGTEGGAPAPGTPTGSATVFTSLYHQHHHTTTTTHTTTVQFAPSLPPPLAPAPPPLPPSTHVYPPTGKQRKSK